MLVFYLVVWALCVSILSRRLWLYHYSLCLFIFKCLVDFWFNYIKVVNYGSGLTKTALFSIYDFISSRYQMSLVLIIFSTPFVMVFKKSYWSVAVDGVFIFSGFNDWNNYAFFSMCLEVYIISKSYCICVSRWFLAVFPKLWMKQYGIPSELRLLLLHFLYGERFV